MSPWRRRQEGSASLEIALLAPVLMAMLALVLQLGRFGVARADVDGAARDAARAASLERTAGATQDAARHAAAAALAGRNVTCRGGPRTVVDTSEFDATPGFVTVRVECDVDLSDLSLLALPGTRTMAASFVEAVDTFRGRG